MECGSPQARSPPLARGMPPTTTDSTLTAIVDAAAASQQVPGVALAVWQGSEEAYSYCGGHANLDTACHVTADSAFRIGSLTKQFVAALLRKLKHQGKLSLGDPAQRYLTFLPEHAPFSIRELLQHTAGVSDGEYSTEGVSSQLTQAERKVTALPLPTAASKLLFEPFGLTHTASDHPSNLIKARTSGYTHRHRGFAIQQC